MNQEKNNLNMNNFNNEFNNETSNTNIQNEILSNDIINEQARMAQAINNSTQNMNYSQPQMNNSISNEELLRAYIGEKYDKIIKQEFNVAAFFFTYLYMYYRKMYLYGVVLFILNLIIANIIPSFSMAINLAAGLLINKLYIKHANKKIEKIKFQNQQKTISEIKEICTSKGGTSIGIILLGLLTEFIIIIAYFLISLLFGIGGTVGDLISDIFNYGNGTYNGLLMYDSIDPREEFTITIPEVFEKDSEKSKTYEYSKGDGIYNQCSVEFVVPNGFTSSEDLISQMSSYHIGEASLVQKESINDIEWNWFLENDDFGTNYYYATTKEDKVYLLKYTIGRDTTNECKTYREEILNSINQK